MDTSSSARKETGWLLHQIVDESKKSILEKHPTLKQIYGNLTPASSLVRQRRTQFAGHCQRATNEIISSLVLWKPHADGRRGRKLTFPDVISRDTGIGLEDLKVAMEDRDVWKSVVKSVVSTEVEK